MPSLRSRRRLVCHYCGRRSNLFFEGQPRFNCTSCEATNWLDEHGEITDPLVDGKTPVRNSDARKPDASDDSPFCATCLRNQHMVQSSLAQFEWPEDETGAEYLARDKKYHLLSQDLRSRYPEVCADCEPRVMKRLGQASYTAQTDHLRRMITKTRSQRTEVKSWGALDFLDLGGKWAWHASYVLQFTWHVATVFSLSADSVAMAEIRPAWILSVARVLRQLGSSPLGSPRVLTFAIQFGLCSFPWNPRFKQSIRGFTAHILGFKQWYTFQLLAVLVRTMALSASQYALSHGLTPSAQLGAQVFLTVFTIYIYRMAPGSIRIDTTPLFKRPQQSSESAREGTKGIQKPTAVQKEPSSLGDALDDILREPSAPGLAQDDYEDDLVDAGFNPRRPLAAAPKRALFGQGQRIGLNDGSAFGSMDLSGISAPPQNEAPAVHYEEEMDWSPSTSQHRAFNTYNSYNVKNPNPRFNDIPVEPKPGPFWYKGIPPAPTNPAQRARNPPSRPTIREALKPQQESSIFTRDHNRKPVQLGPPFVEKATSLNIAEPKFYAPEARNDPRDGLSSMFASSFSISHAEEAEAEKRNAALMARTPDVLGQRRLAARLPELVAVLGALYAWNSAALSTETYGITIALASLCAALMVSLRLMADLLVDLQLRHGPQASLLQPSWASVALIQIIGNLTLLTMVWSGKNAFIMSSPDVVLFGNVLFGAVIAHHVLHILV